MSDSGKKTDEQPNSSEGFFTLKNILIMVAVIVLLILIAVFAIPKIVEWFSGPSSTGSSTPNLGAKSGSE